jgi:hypothetical protein
VEPPAVAAAAGGSPVAACPFLHCSLALSGPLEGVQMQQASHAGMGVSWGPGTPLRGSSLPHSAEGECVDRDNKKGQQASAGWIVC